jgi:hypothetical protein
MSRAPLRTKRRLKLGELVPDCIAPGLKAQGFADASLHLHWAEIAGADLARFCEPIALRWPVSRGDNEHARPRGGSLTVRVVSAFSLDLQHMAPVILQRVNAHFGWRCVERISFKQGPLRRKAAFARPARPTLGPDQSAALDQLLTDIGDDGLKTALAKLGVGVLGARKG